MDDTSTLDPTHSPETEEDKNLLVLRHTSADIASQPWAGCYRWFAVINAVYRNSSRGRYDDSPYLQTTADQQSKSSHDAVDPESCEDSDDSFDWAIVAPSPLEEESQMAWPEEIVCVDTISSESFTRLPHIPKRASFLRRSHTIDIQRTTLCPDQMNGGALGAHQSADSRGIQLQQPCLPAAQSVRVNIEQSDGGYIKRRRIDSFEPSAEDGTIASCLPESASDTATQLMTCDNYDVIMRCERSRDVNNCRLQLADEEEYESAWHYAAVMLPRLLASRPALWVTTPASRLRRPSIDEDKLSPERRAGWLATLRLEKKVARSLMLERWTRENTGKEGFLAPPPRSIMMQRGR